MRLTRVKAMNFLGYEAVDIDLAEINDLVIVGDNMAGKSALLDAVLWACFDKINRPGIRPASDAVVRDGADLALVGVEFTSGDNEVQVLREKPRGKTGTLNLWVNGEMRTRHTSAETFRAISDLVGLSFAGLMQGPFMVQKSADSFMALQPRERKDLLIGLLGLDIYEDLHEAAKQQRDESEAARAVAETRIDALQRLLAESEDLPQRLASAEAEAIVLRGDLDGINAIVTAERERLASARAHDSQYAAASRQIDRLRDQIETTRSSLMGANLGLAQHALPLADRPPVPPMVDDSEIAAMQVRVQTAREEREAWLANDAALTQAETALQTAERAVEVMADVPCQHLNYPDPRGGEVQMLADVAKQCLGCQFLVDAAAARTDLPDLWAERERLRHLVGGSKTPDVSALTAELEDLLRRDRGHSAAFAEAAAWDAREVGRAQAHQTATERVAELEERLTADEAEMRRLHEEHAPILNAHGQVETLEAKVTEYERQKASAESGLRAAEAEVTALKGHIAVRNRHGEDLSIERLRRVDAVGKAHVYRILAIAFGRDGIPTNIIEATIPLIEDAANDVLARLPGDMRLSLRTQRESKTGGMIERLEVVVMTDGWAREYGLLSVGGRFRVDLAIRLGLGRVLANRSGSRIESLWFDEPLADLDALSREAVIETLAAIRDEFPLTVVVSHHPEFNDQFSNVLQVTMTDGVSSAVMA